MVQSELKYLIGGKIVNWKCRVFGGKTGPFPTVHAFGMVRPARMVWLRVEQNSEPTREFGPVANTTMMIRLDGIMVERTCSPNQLPQIASHQGHLRSGLGMDSPNPPRVRTHAP